MAPLAQIGKPLPRPDAVEKVTGKAMYADDFRFERACSTPPPCAAYPHVRILDIDTQAAQALPGVHAVLTYRNVPGDPRRGLVENDWPVFGRRRIPGVIVGDPIALAVAKRRTCPPGAWPDPRRL